MDGSRSISSTIASRSASRKLMMRGSGIDVVLDRFGRGHRRLLGEADGVLDLRLGLVVDRPELLLGRDAEGADALGEDADRVPLHPLLHLLLGAVRGWSATEWPRKRYVFASRKKGRLSFLALLMAWRVASRISSTSSPFTISASIG